MDPSSSSQVFGFTLPGPGYLFGSLLFGLIGIAAFRYGRKTGRPRTTGIGIALMLYPYAISRTWLLYAIGVALCAMIWFDRG